MKLISKKEIAELFDVKQENCISIFIPTHRAGEKVLNEEDTLALKNQLKEVTHKLEQRELKPNEIDKLTQPIQKLIDDSSFWREQSDGLAIFVANDFFRYYTLPVHFERYNYISNSFYLKPLMPMFVGDGNFYLLMLERRNVELYECTRHTFAEIEIDDLIPASKRDRVGFDYEEKHLQFRTQHAGSGQAMFHGQEAATGKRRNEIKQYLRAINDGIVPILNEGNIPLLVAAQRPNFDIYEEVNTYPHLVKENLTVNFGDTDMLETHEMAWKKMESIFDQDRKDKIALFNEGQGTGKTDIGIDEILPAAFNGRVDTLFCENTADIFGTYTNENDVISVEQSEENDNTISLMNLAAVQTFINGGQVYLMDKEDMPNSNSRINALYRY